MDVDTPAQAEARDEVAESAADVAQAAAAVVMADTIANGDAEWKSELLDRLARIEAKQDELALASVIAEAEPEPTVTAEAEPLTVEKPTPPPAKGTKRHNRKRPLRFG